MACVCDTVNLSPLEVATSPLILPHLACVLMNASLQTKEQGTSQTSSLANTNAHINS